MRFRYRGRHGDGLLRLTANCYESLVFLLGGLVWRVLGADPPLAQLSVDCIQIIRRCEVLKVGGTKARTRFSSDESCYLPCLEVGGAARLLAENGLGRQENYARFGLK